MVKRSQPIRSIVKKKETYDIGRDFAFALMEGVALQRLVPRGQRPASDYLDALKQMFRLLLAPADDTTGGTS